jgi:DNA polymerase-1
MHTVRAAELFGKVESDVTPAERKTAKAFSFMLQYGAGAKHMAAETGHHLDVARDFIKNYYARYPMVKQWQDDNIELAKKNAVPTGRKTPKGYPETYSTLHSETGRQYTIVGRDAPDFMTEKGVYVSPSPTEIKNYPIQGGATGDIVPMMLGIVHRHLLKGEIGMHCRLIGTVHDSILLDAEGEWVYNIGNEVKKLMEDAPRIYEKIFGVKFSLPLKVEVEVGETWGSMVELDL